MYARDGQNIFYTVASKHLEMQILPVRGREKADILFSPVASHSNKCEIGQFKLQWKRTTSPPRYSDESGYRIIIKIEETFNCIHWMIRNGVILYHVQLLPVKQIAD